jgi:hypothetical protein
MARNILSARQVQIAADGDHFDVDGLLLRSRSGRGSWVFRYIAPDGRRREMGLETVARNNITETGKSLASARDLAEDARTFLRESVDPIEVGDRKRSDAKRTREPERSLDLLLARFVVCSVRRERFGAFLVCSVERP